VFGFFYVIAVVVAVAVFHLLTAQRAILSLWWPFTALDKKLIGAVFLQAFTALHCIFGKG
jgi:hypothetical protein